VHVGLNDWSASSAKRVTAKTKCGGLAPQRRQVFPIMVDSVLVGNPIARRVCRPGLSVTESGATRPANHDGPRGRAIAHQT
jgi:hypothetical protein